MLKRSLVKDGDNQFSNESDRPWFYGVQIPELYQLEINCQRMARYCGVIPQRVGFRRFEMKDGIMT